MARIKINGSVIAGDSIIISRNRVIVDGEDVTPDSKEIRISVEGNIRHLDAGACGSVDVKGDVESLDVQAGNVTVTGNVSAQAGDITCGNVGGSVSTMAGDINYRK